jgi:7-cyano-7-deazaguanine synthase
VHALTVAYGQRHAVEVERAVAIAKRLAAASHRIVTVDMSFLRGSALTDREIAVPKDRSDGEIAHGIPATYVPARNTVLLSLALAWAESLEARDLVIGVNAIDFSGYPDCRPEFLRAFEALAAAGTRAGAQGDAWHVHAPLQHATKADIVRQAVALGVPLELTISCYDPGQGGVPCGACDACLLRARGFDEAGVVDPTDRRETR